MAKILLVHGMRMQARASEVKLMEDWPAAVQACVAGSAWGKRNASRIPALAHIEVVYWGDLFRRPKRPAPKLVWKGPAMNAIKDAFYATLRASLRAADKVGFFDREGRPRGLIAPYVDKFLQQTSVYMHDGPVFNATPGVRGGAFAQVQHRFTEKLFDETNPPAVVIGHSLGSVIAYEGLCTNPHSVRSFITIGSPLATPDLILKPLRERLGRALTVRERDLPWPGVYRWENFVSAADVWCVPVKKLAPLFPKRPISDHMVRHGTASPVEKDAHATHRLETYLLEHRQIGDAIGEGLDLSLPGKNLPARAMR